jgi:hypothetical protein
LESAPGAFLLFKSFLLKNKILRKRFLIPKRSEGSHRLMQPPEINTRGFLRKIAVKGIYEIRGENTILKPG